MFGVVELAPAVGAVAPPTLQPAVDNDQTFPSLALVDFDFVPIPSCADDHLLQPDLV